MSVPDRAARARAAALSFAVGAACWWIVLEGGLFGVGLVVLILAMLLATPLRSAERIGSFILGVGLTGTALMSLSILTTPHCGGYGSGHAGECVVGGEGLLAIFALITVSGALVLFFGRKGLARRTPPRPAAPGSQ